LRLLVSFPQALQQAAAVYQRILADLSFNRLVGTPMAGLPIGTAVALTMNRPLIYPRPQAKSYGTGKLIEGVWEPGETAVILDDLITSGDSLLQTANTLIKAGLQVNDAVVLIDRQQGGREFLQSRDVTLHSGVTLSHILAVLEQHGRITAAQRAEVVDSLNLKE
jgi:uridine monophosphate synthetase